MRRLLALTVLPLATVMLMACSGPGSTPQASPPESPAATTVIPVPSTEVFTPIVGSALTEPIATPMTDGKIHLAYELMLTNVLSMPVTIDDVTVRGDTDTTLLALRGDELIPWMRISGSATPGRILGPGQQASVMLDVSVPTQGEVPKILNHRLTITPESAMPPMFASPMTQPVASTLVSTDTPIVISPPLRGPGWFDANSCCQATPHRKAINPINGSQFAPERFAIDFVRLSEQGTVFDGPMDQLSSYPFYGADILAVADGPVVSMGWDLPDVTAGTNPTGLELSQYGGNFVVQDIGNGHYAFYAHLQGDNPKHVRVGQVLSRGETLGFLGNSGNSSMPHLHFHIMDSPLPLGSNGLPFLIDRFTLAGTVSEPQMEKCTNESVPCQVDRSGAAEMTNLSPLYLNVLDFRG